MSKDIRNGLEVLTRTDLVNNLIVEMDRLEAIPSIMRTIARLSEKDEEIIKLARHVENIVLTAHNELDYMQERIEKAGVVGGLAEILPTIPTSIRVED